MRTEPAMIGAIRYALDLLSGFKAETGHDPGLHRCGSLMVALTDQRMRQYESQVANAHHYGIEASFITDREILKLAPTIDVSILKGAFFVPGDGFVDPSVCARAYASAAADLGVRIVTDARVSRILINGDEAHGVEVDNRPFAAEQVVVTAGPWTAGLARVAGIDLPVETIRHQRVVTAPCTVLPDHFPVVRVTDISCYVRREKSGYLYGFFEPDPEAIDLHAKPGTFTTDSIPPPIEVMYEASKRLSPVFPELARLPVHERSQGITSFAPDGAYVIGRYPGISNLYFATGCAALGIAGSAAIGKWLAQSVLSTADETDLKLFDPARFSDRAADKTWIRRKSRDFYANYYAIESGRA